MAKPNPSPQLSIDWAHIGDKVYEVLVIARSRPRELVEFARQKSVPYESVVAAAITQMVSEHVEAGLAKKSSSKAATKAKTRAV